jgi:hypothetical protein
MAEIGEGTIRVADEYGPSGGGKGRGEEIRARYQKSVIDAEYEGELFEEQRVRR